MLNFQFYMPTRLIFGPGTLNQLGETPYLPRGNRAMIVIGSSGAMLTNGYLARVQGLLSNQGVASIIYDKIRPNPESDQVEEAAATCRDKKVDFVVGLGGGSSIDAAKSIALLAANSGSYWDYMHGGTGGGKTPENPALPIVAVPTTAGTGTEADPWTVITKTGAAEKIGWGNDSTFPALSVVDPELMLTVPPRMTAFTGMDAFFHAVESFLNMNRQPMNDMLALEATHLIARFLPELVNNPASLELRTIQAWASTAAGICESIGGCISHHSMEHALSAMNPDLPHGAGLVMLSVPYFTKLAELAPMGFVDLSAAMGAEGMGTPENLQPHTFVDMLKKLIHDAGLSEEKLTDYGFTTDDAPKLTNIAYDTMGGLFPCTPGDMSRKDVEAIFRAAIG